MYMERDEYKSRWLEVCKRMIVLKGALYTAGYLAGFVVCLGRTDYRIVRKLAELERDLDIR
jgi:hypothetical protein